MVSDEGRKYPATLLGFGFGVVFLGAAYLVIPSCPGKTTLLGLALERDCRFIKVFGHSTTL